MRLRLDAPPARRVQYQRATARLRYVRVSRSRWARSSGNPGAPGAADWKISPS